MNILTISENTEYLHDLSVGLQCGHIDDKIETNERWEVMRMASVKVSEFKLQWHPALCSATEQELAENKNDLIFNREYNLSKKPLQIDLLVIEKLDDVDIKNEIGHIFRKYNLWEFKSPDDDLTIDDFFKTVGYACIYKGLGNKVDQIPIDQITVSLLREGKPIKLFKKLEECGYPVEREYNGIYHVTGFFIPVQIIVTKELDSGKHKNFKVLSRNLREEDILAFVDEAQNFTDPGERENVDAILQVSLSANYELYEDMIRRYPKMCEAMRRLMKDEIEDEVREGEKKGFLEALFGLVKDNILSVADAAKRADMSVADFEKAYKTFCL